MEFLPIEFKTVEQREDHFRNNFTDIFGEKAVKKIISGGFCSAPASTKFHGAYAGGLYDHSVNVAEQLSRISFMMGITWERHESPLVIGILHDLCKIDQYKAEGDGKFAWNSETTIQGHGIKSVLYAQMLGIQLTEEEIACILYHMGAFTEKGEWSNYTNAIHRFPNVLWTHTADMVVSQIMEV